MALITYGLCALVALLCAWLLLTAWQRHGLRLLLWSGLCFAGFTLNNVLLVLDKVVYPGGVARKMTVYFRKPGDAQFSREVVEGAPSGRFDATVPGLSVQAPSLEYHVVLLDDNGASVAAAGSLGQPLSVGVARTPSPVYKRGWFWGVVGGVAAAGAIATGLALGLPRGSSAPVTVNPQ